MFCIKTDRADYDNFGNKSARPIFLHNRCIFHWEIVLPMRIANHYVMLEMWLPRWIAVYPIIGEGLPRPGFRRFWGVGGGRSVRVTLIPSMFDYRGGQTPRFSFKSKNLAILIHYDRDNEIPFKTKMTILFKNPFWHFWGAWSASFEIKIDRGVYLGKPILDIP